MAPTTKRSTIYFDPDLHHALRIKAAHSGRSLSEIVNDALRITLREDEEDLAAIADRGVEPTMTYDELLKTLKAHGKI